MKSLFFKIKQILFSFFFLCLIFQDVIQQYLSFFSYFDEIIGLFGAVILAFNILTKRIMKNGWKIIVSLLSFVVVLCVPTFLYRIQPLKASILDLFLVLKFYFAMFFGCFLFANFIDKKIIKKNISVLSKLCIMIYVFGYFYSFFNPNYYSINSGTFGIRSLKLFYSEPLIFVANSVLLLSFLHILEKKNYLWKLILLILLFLTFKTKAYLAILIYILIPIYKNIKKYKYLFIFGSILLVFIFSYNRVMYYFIDNPNFARPQLLIKSVFIARDYFPFGAGLATYGSFQSQVFYSPLYYEYELSTIYGLSFEQRFFISDCFWPMILGESGFLGLINYLLLLFIIFKMIVNIYNKNMKEACLFLFFYLLVASTNEAAFVHYYSIPMAMLMGIVINNQIIKSRGK